MVNISIRLINLGYYSLSFNARHTILKESGLIRQKPGSNCDKVSFRLSRDTLQLNGVLEHGKILVSKENELLHEPCMLQE